MPAKDREAVPDLTAFGDRCAVLRRQASSYKIRAKSVGYVLFYEEGAETGPFFISAYAALNVLCGSITNFFGTPASNSP